jgi:3-demethoxyubiquinol 3-hydroxylase
MSLLEMAIMQFDTALRTLVPPKKRAAQRINPAAYYQNGTLSYQQKKHVAALVRVNHAGEVCAQALYQGQALTANLASVRTQMQQAAFEEVDHLAWCEERLMEIGAHPSILNPLWYSASFLLGAVAGIIGDDWSLGFVAETEKQVARHLQNHIAQLPQFDAKTYALLLQMKQDEEAHAASALDAGARALPQVVKKLMSICSKAMTYGSYII